MPDLNCAVCSTKYNKNWFKTAHAGMIFSGVSWKERQELDVWWRAHLQNKMSRRPLSPWASTLPLSYPASILFSTTKCAVKFIVAKLTSRLCHILTNIKSWIKLPREPSLAASKNKNPTTFTKAFLKLFIFFVVYGPFSSMHPDLSFHVWPCHCPSATSDWLF